LASPIGLWRDDHPLPDMFGLPFQRMDTLLWKDGEVPAWLNSADDPKDEVEKQVATMQAMATFAKFIWPIPDRRLRRRLPRISAETLVIAGADDPFLPSIYLNDFTAAIARARSVTVANAAHIRVTLVGVAFYDRQHNQTGRAKNGIDLHPILDITFDDEPVVAAVAPAAGGLNALTTLFAKKATWSANNPAIREKPDDDEDEDDDEPSANKVRLGGNGHPQTDSVWQSARIDHTSRKASLHFALRVKTDNRETVDSADTLAVQVRSAQGKLLKTLARFSNSDASKRTKSINLDVSKYRGQFIAKENSNKATRFVINNPHVAYR